MKINTLILMAGPGEKFQEAGFTFPKTLVEFSGEPLLKHVLQNLNPLKKLGGEFICAVKHNENQRYHISSVIRLLEPATRIIEVRGETQGAVCTALLAIEHINNKTPLIITNGDQIISADLNAAVEDFQRRDLDGGIIIFEAVHPRWSFVRCDCNGHVIEAAEKRPISNMATAGFYYYKNGKDFVECSQKMILKNAHVGGNYYVCPTFNEMVLNQKRVGIYKISKTDYFSLATPEGVSIYERYLKDKP